MAATIRSSNLGGGSSGTASLTYSSPNNGDLLIAIISYSQFSTARTISTPAGWTKHVDQTDAGSVNSLAIFSKTWTTGDPTTFNWTISGASNDWWNAVGYVTAGGSLETSNIPYAASTSVSGTPTGGSGLAILAASTGGDGSDSGMTATGWTTDQNTTAGTWHICSAAHKNFSLPGTVSATPIWGGGLTNNQAAILFLDDVGGFSYTESITVSSKTTPSGTDSLIHSYSESATIKSVTTPSGLDVLYQDADTPISVTDVSNSSEDYLAPTGYWGAADDDNGAI